jgi:hypothetical protein
MKKVLENTCNELGDKLLDEMALPPLSSKLQLALKACHAVGPTITGEICFAWIGQKFRAKGVTYRDLAALAPSVTWKEVARGDTASTTGLFR